MQFPDWSAGKCGAVSAAFISAVWVLSAAPSADAQAPGNAARGKMQFLQCQACHTLNAGDRDGVGPNLYGVVGAKAASRQGYSYSPQLSVAGIIWTPQALDTFLTRPSALVPGTRMAFAGIQSQQNRQDLIAYIGSVGAKSVKRK